MVHLARQDLSVAGKRKGLSGERSGLFMEQIRIIKEMRQRDRDNGRTGRFVRPRYCVFENVPGLFSSNKGADFQAVLTEFVRVSQTDAPDVPMPDKGKWPRAGWLYDEMGRWSVAWRTHNASEWGVPQRRRRIAVVADFNGLTAPEILFDPQYRRETESSEPNETEPDFGGECRREVPPVEQGLSGHSQPSGEAGEGTPPGVESGVDGTGIAGCLDSYYGNGPGERGGENGKSSANKCFSIQGNTIDRNVKQGGGA